jgi:isocitrate dehydrogenase
LGWREAGAAISRAMETAIAGKKVTYDLARQIEGATEVKCSEFAGCIIEAM